MRKAKWIALLAALCVLAMSLPAFAQLAEGNWPKFGRDYRNSGHSPATSIAKPVLKWASECKPFGSTAATWRSSSYDGVKIDPQGNVYAYADYCFGMAKFSPTGVRLFNDTGVTDANQFVYFNGPALYDDGVNKLVVCGPQHATAYYPVYVTGGSADECGGAGYVYSETHDWRRVEFLNWDLQGQYRSPNFNMANVGSHLPACGTGVPYKALPGWTSHMSPAIGPDGTVYAGNFQISYHDPVGPFVALNPLNGAIKWSFTQWGMGRCLGTPAIKTVQHEAQTKNVIYVTGGNYWEPSGTFGQPSIMALRDDGASPTLLWKKSRHSSDNDPVLGTSCGMFTSAAVLSEDGSTVYAAGRDSWQIRRVNQAVARPITGTLFAYDADTGALKWKINTGGTHVFSPATGPGGMLYLSGGHFRTGANSDVPPLNTPGKIIAVKDNGLSATVKWTMELPDDADSCTTTIATINTNPTTMYVASGNGRVYCVQDLGDKPKMLWTWHAYDLRYASSTARGYAPTNIAVADDGSISIGMMNHVYTFQPGFDPNSPEGISGYVKDSAGNPVAGAWVAASTSARPFLNNAKRIWTKTNYDGSYQISPKDTGTYYVAACAVGKEGTEDTVAVFSASADKIAANFALNTAKVNWSMIGNVTSANAKTAHPATNAADGNLATKFESTALPSALSVDLGVAKSISEAVIYWDGWRCGKDFAVQYSDDGAAWNSVYTTTAGNGGFPIDFYAADPTKAGPPYADGVGNVNPGSVKTGANVVKFPAVTARYWRVNVTAAIVAPIGAHTTQGATQNHTAIWEFELRDATKPGPVPGSIAEARAAEDGDAANIAGAVVTAVAGGGVPENTLFIESEDRTCGIQVQVANLGNLNIGVSDKVSVGGMIQTIAGEKLIAANKVVRLGNGVPVEILSMNNRAAAEAKAQGMFIKTWGKVTEVGSDSFTISDGSPEEITVKCGAIAKPSVNRTVMVRGVTGRDANGPVLYMRDEPADWAYGEAAYQPLPFVGKYKYPREYLILGPFKDAGSTDPGLLNIDFIQAATGVAEANARPSAGDVVGGKVWTRVNSGSSDTLNINTALGEVTEHAAVYVHLYLWSAIDGVDISLATGSDDWLVAWVNGVEVQRKDENDFPTGRGVQIGQDFTWSPATLNQGLNSVLFKVANGGSGFGLSSQFVSYGEYGVPGYGGYPPLSGIGYVLNNVAP